MDLHLNERVCFVTGGSRGIGKEIVVNLLNEGAYVGTCSRNIEQLHKLKNSLSADQNARFLFFECDVQNQDMVKESIDQTVRVFGRLDGIVANAGHGTSGNVFDTSYSDWNLQFQIKLFSVLNIVNASLPELKKSDAARIVIINGVTANFPDRKMAAVSAARAAVKQVVFLMASELYDYRICVNSINIGAIETDRQHMRYKESGSELEYDSWVDSEAQKRGIPFGRFGRTEEVSPMVLLLLSPLSSYITSSSIDISGGLNALP